MAGESIIKLPLRAALLGALLAAGPLAAKERLSGPVPAQVLAVVDGDTLEVRARIWLGQDIITRVRLAGIDTPEARSDCPRERGLAAAAAAFVQAQVQASSVRLRDIAYGKYAGRVLARVETAQGQDLGAALVRAGFARPYAGGRRAPWCDAASAE
jgi:endonuclease YncB( thermonuclease family)